jgi:hypothetical protein
MPFRDLSSNLGSVLRRWNTLFIDDLCVNRINGQVFTAGTAIVLSSVSGNIIPSSTNLFKLGVVSRNWSNAYIRDVSVSSIDVSLNLNPFNANGSSLGLPNKLWGNAYLRDVSISSIDISLNLNPFLANRASLGAPSKLWGNAYLRDLSASSIDVSLNLKPLTSNNLSLGLLTRRWGNAYLRDVSVSIIAISLNLNPLLNNRSSLGLPGRTWGNAYIRDLSISNIDISSNLNPFAVGSGGTVTQGTGGTVSISGGYIIHSFTTTGTSAFVPTFNGPVEVLIVGGGGGGGPNLGGGGGGGGVIWIPATNVISGTSYPVVVGTGGASGTSGLASSVFGATAAGGGTSGSWPSGSGTAGGSGGGAPANDGAINQGGATSSNILGTNNGIANVGTIYGNRGGHMTTGRTGGPTRAAGGGGAGGQGLDTNSNTTGDTGRTGMGSGGVGVVNAILGPSHYWGGGGGGAAWDNQFGGWGGLGGGGGGSGKSGGGTGGSSALTNGSNGFTNANTNGGAGGANTGGGGGGGNHSSGQGGTGGSGIVVIRYLQSVAGPNTSSLGLSTRRWGNAYIRDVSVTSIDVSGNLNPLLNNTLTLGLINRMWNNAYIRDLSASSIEISGNMFPLVNNNSNLGSASNIWRNHFAVDLSVNTVNGAAYSAGGGGGGSSYVITSITSDIAPSITNTYSLGSTSKFWNNAYINNLRASNRVYQEISGGPFYEINSTVQTWEWHRTNALSLGKTLATILNAEQNEKVRNLFAGQTGTSQADAAFLGGRRTSNSATAGGKTSADWQWVNGDIWSYTNFAGGEPNTIAQQYIQIYANGTWDDIGVVSKRAVYMSYREDPSWAAVNGYYGLAKDAYPSLNPLSSGDLAVRTWTGRPTPLNTFPYFWGSVCWSPQLRLFAAITLYQVMTSSDGITWTMRTPTGGTAHAYWSSICWSPERRLFVAVANEPREGNANKVLTSIDGITWTQTPAVNNFTLWESVCWSPELGLFVAVGGYSPPTFHPYNNTGTGGQNKVMTSNDGTNWNTTPSANNSTEWKGVCWSPELGIFVATAPSGSSPYIMTSSNGTNWTKPPASIATNVPLNAVCWSPQLGIFVGVGGERVTISSNGINWTIAATLTSLSITNEWRSVCWSPELRLFVAVGQPGRVGQKVITSPDGINWTGRSSSNDNYHWRSVCWSSELGIFVATGGEASVPGLKNNVMTSSLKGRPPTSYNLFDSSFNSIDETGKWTFANVATTGTLTVNTTNYNSDDRLKHNEAVIVNGLAVIDRLTPKFYQKTQNILDASYNGDLSGQAWNYEAGLIAQEVLQVPDLSFAVSGGDYYEKVMNYDVSYTLSYYEQKMNSDLSFANGYKEQKISNDLSFTISYYQQKMNSDLSFDVSYNIEQIISDLSYDMSYIIQKMNNDLSFHISYNEQKINYDLSFELNYYQQQAINDLSRANAYEVSSNLITQPYTLNYNSVFIYGLAAIKELHAKVKAQETSILNRQAIINTLTSRIETLEHELSSS